MKRILFNATQMEEVRVAIVDGQKLLNLNIGSVLTEQRKGNIYKAIITRVEASLEAAFIDYGVSRHGFLPLKEINLDHLKNKDDPEYEGFSSGYSVREGQELLVQVDKDERGNKGASFTTYISLAGRFLVLMPNSSKIFGISRRIDIDKRQEVKEIMERLDIPHGMSVIARTASVGKPQEDLIEDLEYLLKLWYTINNAYNTSEDVKPYLVYEESSIVTRSIRDYLQKDIKEIIVDTAEIYEHANHFMSAMNLDSSCKVIRYNDATPLFSKFQIEHQIETAYSRTVRLPSGGSIVIDTTEALSAIDVNSSKSNFGRDIESTALHTNIEAAEEVCRQLRLRDLGGLIVIDFIDMESSKNQREVEQVLKDALRMDRARVQMGRISKFGLLELSRQRLQTSLEECSNDVCPRCSGNGYVRNIFSMSLHILRIIQEESVKPNTSAVQVQLPVKVATYLLNEKKSDILSIENILGVDILIIPNISLETPSYRVDRIKLDGSITDTQVSSYSLIESLPEDDLYFKINGNFDETRMDPVVSSSYYSINNDKFSVYKKGVGLFNLIKRFIARLFCRPKHYLSKEESELVNKKSDFRRNSREGFNKKRFSYKNKSEPDNDLRQKSSSKYPNSNKRNFRKSSSFSKPKRDLEKPVQTAILEQAKEVAPQAAPTKTKNKPLIKPNQGYKYNPESTSNSDKSNMIFIDTKKDNTE